MVSDEFTRKSLEFSEEADWQASYCFAFEGLEILGVANPKLESLKIAAASKLLPEMEPREARLEKAIPPTTLIRSADPESVWLNYLDKPGTFEITETGVRFFHSGKQTSFFWFGVMSGDLTKYEREHYLGRNYFLDFGSATTSGKILEKNTGSKGTFLLFRAESERDKCYEEILQARRKWGEECPPLGDIVVKCNEDGTVTYAITASQWGWTPRLSFSSNLAILDKDEHYIEIYNKSSERIASGTTTGISYRFRSTSRDSSKGAEFTVGFDSNK